MTVAAGLTVAACGGGGADGGGGTDGGGGAASFRPQAERACTDTARAQLELGLEHASGALPDVATHMRELRAEGERALAELEALDPPADAREAWSRYLDNRHSAIELIVRRAAAASAGDRRAMRARAADLTKLLGERDEIGAELGLAACARELPAADEAAVTEVLEIASVSSDARRLCERAIASVVLRNAYGGSVRRCARMQAGRQVADSIEVDELSGVAGVIASARVAYVGGEADGGTATAELLFEDGEYRIHQFRSTPPR